jgi:vesicle-fusing ATPase
MGLSEGSRVTVVVLPHPPHPEAPLPIREVKVQLDFLKRGYQNAEPYLADDMISKFMDQYRGIIMSDNEPILYKYHGEKLKGKVLSLALPAATKRAAGVLTDATCLSFVSPQYSSMQVIPSAKRSVLSVLTDSLPNPADASVPGIAR